MNCVETKQPKWYRSLFALMLLYSLASCVSVRDVGIEMRKIETGLGYELTSPEYRGELFCNVLLNPIHGAGLVPVTAVKKKGTTVIPLLLYNYTGETFEVTLGETSLNIPYQYFVVDALVSECNTSTCFNLYASKDSLVAQTDYQIDIKVGRCQTSSQVKFNTHTILFVDFFSMDPDFLSVLSHKVRPALTDLEFVVTVKQRDDVFFQKEYVLRHSHSPRWNSMDELNDLSYSCVDNMAVGLSLATKEIVEEIAADLNRVVMERFLSEGRSAD